MRHKAGHLCDDETRRIRKAAEFVESFETHRNRFSASVWSVECRIVGQYELRLVHAVELWREAWMTHIGRNWTFE